MTGVPSNNDANVTAAVAAANLHEDPCAALLALNPSAVVQRAVEAHRLPQLQAFLHQLVTAWRQAARNQLDTAAAATAALEDEIATTEDNPEETNYNAWCAEDYEVSMIPSPFVLWKCCHKDCKEKPWHFCVEKGKYVNKQELRTEEEVEAGLRAHPALKQFGRRWYHVNNDEEIPTGGGRFKVRKHWLKDHPQVPIDKWPAAFAFKKMILEQEKRRIAEAKAREAKAAEQKTLAARRAAESQRDHEVWVLAGKPSRMAHLIQARASNCVVRWASTGKVETVPSSSVHSHVSFRREPKKNSRNSRSTKAAGAATGAASPESCHPRESAKRPHDTDAAISSAAAKRLKESSPISVPVTEVTPVLPPTKKNLVVNSHATPPSKMTSTGTLTASARDDVGTTPPTEKSGPTTVPIASTPTTVVASADGVSRATMVSPMKAWRPRFTQHDGVLYDEDDSD
jgi:hypothetical protein